MASPAAEKARQSHMSKHTPRQIVTAFKKSVQNF
jgi:hypothetical protein